MGTGGGMRAGCMGFGLLGVLVAVGMVAWLGSRASDEIRSDRQPPVQTSLASTTEASASVVKVAADPSTGLTGDVSITVSASGLRPGDKVTLVACSAAIDAIRTEGGSCDADSEMSATVSAAGNIEVRFAMSRVLTASGLPIDCAATTSRCEVQVRDLESTALGSVPLTFAEDLERPDLLTDLGG